ncbi:uncharacterized protein J3D65DRAFT_625427 [Phyllosticta citribraziliensis]|uniref:Secreted protein n=1 Tax=Phyllosticta citribraziliensis TaxID=989973 RepID=A0ABR1LRM9_9PEZI
MFGTCVLLLVSICSTVHGFQSCCQFLLVVVVIDNSNCSTSPPQNVAADSIFCGGRPNRQNIDKPPRRKTK